MNPTKEELDEAIAFLKDGFRQDASMIKTALTILTRYRDGELVEKDRWISVKDRLPELGEEFNVIVDLNDGMEPLASCADWNALKKEWFYIGTEMKMTGVTHWQPLPTPPTNQTEKS